MIKSNVLSAVLGFECTPYIEDDGSFWVLTQYGWNKGEPSLENAKQYPKGLNIYELNHKCKEWAIDKGYQFKVFIHYDGTESWEVGKCGYGWDEYRCSSIIEACEYIFTALAGSSVTKMDAQTKCNQIEKDQ